MPFPSKQVLSDLIKRGWRYRSGEALLQRLEASAEAMAEHQRTSRQQIRAFEESGE